MTLLTMRILTLGQRTTCKMTLWPNSTGTTAKKLVNDSRIKNLAVKDGLIATTSANAHDLQRKDYTRNYLATQREITGSVRTRFQSIKSIQSTGTTAKEPLNAYHSRGWCGFRNMLPDIVRLAGWWRYASTGNIACAWDACKTMKPQNMYYSVRIRERRNTSKAWPKNLTSN